MDPEEAATPKKPRLPARQRKIAEQIREAREADLWDLGDATKATPGEKAPARPADEQSSTPEDMDAVDAQKAEPPQSAAPEPKADSAIQTDVRSKLSKRKPKRKPSQEAYREVSSPPVAEKLTHRSTESKAAAKSVPGEETPESESTRTRPKAGAIDELHLWDDALPSLGGETTPESPPAAEPTDPVSPTPDDAEDAPEGDSTSSGKNAPAAHEVPAENTPPEDATATSETGDNAEEIADTPEIAAPAPADQTPKNWLAKLSKIELISTIALLTLLLAASIYFARNSVGLIPEEDGKQSVDLPVRGKLTTIVKADTYWVSENQARLPNEKPQILPAIELQAKGGKVIVRVLFRNEEGILQGDPRTLALTPGKAAEIRSTVGFKAYSDFSGYLTGDVDPWTVEVYEGSDPEAGLSHYHKLFGTVISPEKR